MKTFKKMFSLFGSFIKTKKHYKKNKSRKQKKHRKNKSYKKMKGG